jgi:hypothetical protein
VKLTCPALKIFSSLAVLLLLPSFLFVWGKQGSLGGGLLVSSVLIVALNFNRSAFRVPVRWFLGAFIGGCVVFLSAIISFFAYLDAKPLVSLLIVFPLLAVFLLYKKIDACPFSEIFKALWYLFSVLVFFGVLKFFWAPEFGGYEYRPKAVFPFSEESHYALALGVVSMALVFGGSVRLGIGIILVLMLFSVSFPSLTMLVFASLGVVVLSLKRPFFFFPIALLFLFALSFVFSMGYFSDRVDFSSGGNLTTLVFLQGVDLIVYALVDGGVLGVGYQMLGGSSTPVLEVSESIYNLTGTYMNIEDGGFLAAKLIAEFGYLGLFFVFVYLFFLVRAVVFWLVKINFFSGCFEENTAGKAKLAAGAMIGLVVELFLRGYGYFSPTLFFVLTFLPFVCIGTRRFSLGEVRTGGLEG